MNKKKEDGKYIYCIVENGDPMNLGPLGIGGRDDKVYTICYRDISAAVSDSPIIKYSATRENFIAHELVIEKVMKENVVLPVKFCTIAENEEKVKLILQREYTKFKNILEKMRDKKELGLKAVFKEDGIYKEILQKYEEIRILKESLTSKSPQNTYYQSVEIGKKVESALQNEKEIYKKYILDILSPMSTEDCINNTYGERMILNAAFLVSDSRESDFDKEVKSLDAVYGDKIKFKYIGTIPPFNFVNLVINLEDY